MDKKLSLVNASVIHRRFGTGIVFEQTDSVIKVRFREKDSLFQYPDAFETFLQCKDTALQAQLSEMISHQKSKKAFVRQVLLDDLAKKAERQAETSAAAKGNYAARGNAAFKCTYCDGGRTETLFGFRGVCSEKTLFCNVEQNRYKSCCGENSPCQRYCEGLLQKAELERCFREGGLSCYESRLLERWEVYTGASLLGKNKDRPVVLNRIQRNSLIVLTAKPAFCAERERCIFGVFLMDDSYRGENKTAGRICSASPFRLCLSPADAEKMLFWRYYYNKNSPERTVWGQGQHRYLSDRQAASILKDICTLKEGTAEETLSRRFFETFCRVNRIEQKGLPRREGTLERQNIL